MYCLNCGTQLTGSETVCPKCGIAIPASVKTNGTTSSQNGTASQSVWKRQRNLNKYVRIGLSAVAVIFFIYNYRNNTSNLAIQTNNQTVNETTASQTADSDQKAVEGFKEAYANATDPSTKLITLKNLAIAYANIQDTADEINTLQLALGYAPANSVDYYYVLALTAEAEDKPADIQTDLDQAYKINPQNVQIVAELSFFYRDDEAEWKDYDNYAKGLAYAKEAYALNVGPDTTMGLADGYYLNGDYDKSISLLKPFDTNAIPEAAIEIAYDYAAKNDPSDAKIYFQKAVDGGLILSPAIIKYMQTH